MADTRPRAALNGKTINLGQLAAEVGTALTASDTEVVVANPDSTITGAALEAALTAHVADPLWAATPEEANQHTIEQRAETALASNATFLGLASPTAAQNAAQVKALTRQMNGLIRLRLRRLDAVD